MDRQMDRLQLVLGSKDAAWIGVHVSRGETRDLLKEGIRAAKSLETVWSYDFAPRNERTGQIVIKGESPRGDLSLQMGRRRGYACRDSLRLIDRETGFEPALTSLFAAGLCADLALGRGANRFSKAPAKMAIIADRGIKPGETEWGEGEVDNFLSGYVLELTETGALRRIMARPADAANFWVLMAEALWDPEIRKRIAIGLIDKATIVLLSQLAGAWLEIQGEMAIRVSGTTFVLKDNECSRVWRQLMEWEGGGIRKGTLRYLSGYKTQMPHAEEKVVRGEMSAAREKGNKNRPGVNAQGLMNMKGAVAFIARQLLEEASIYGACEPTGSFRMQLPRGMTLRELGAHSMRVYLLPLEGMWVALERDDEPGVSFRWTVREPHLQRWALDSGLLPIVHLTCAALWRDLRVGGSEVMQEEASAAEEAEVSQVGKGRVRFRGRIKWGSEGDLETIMREATTVRWHMRKLGYGKRASRRARALARRLGVDLPPGTTIVRSHRRGEPERDARNVPVRAQGLAQLILTERYCRCEG